MRYKVDGKNISIPDAWIQKTQRDLGLNLPDTIALYLSDEGIKVDPVVTELTNKAKAAGTGAKATGEKKERKAPVRKPDEVKRSVIAALASFINQEEYGVTNVEITNVERMVAFELAGDRYEITLTKKRKPKDE